MRLHSHWPTIEHAFGCALPDRFLMAIRSFDNAKTVTPFILEKKDGKRFGLFLHVEKGNVQAAMLPAQIEQRFYNPYYNFDAGEQSPAVKRNLEELLDELAAGERELVLDDHVPQSIVRRLEKRFEISFDNMMGIGSVRARRLEPHEVLEVLSRERPNGRRIAKKIIEKSRHREALSGFLDRHEDGRFALLDKLLSGEDLQSLIVTSALNVQELTGLPMRGNSRALAAVYSRDKGLWRIAAGPQSEGKEYPSLRVAIEEITGKGRAGVEMDDMPAWMFSAMGLRDREAVPADNLVRMWRDSSTLPDLAFYILAARASAHAIMKALAFASMHRSSRITEMDAYKVYLDELYGYVSAHAPELRVARTLTNFHCGNRTIFPSNPAAHPIDERINTLKIDAGCMIFDRSGTLLGCSDIARTLCLTKDGEEIYQIFRDSVVDRLIPACKIGADGASIHRLAVEDLKRVNLPGNTLSRAVAVPADFDRDVGHVLGKNNLSHVQFTASGHAVLREGMIACCEYQWPLKGHTVAYEDTGLVTGSGGLNFTID